MTGTQTNSTNSPWQLKPGMHLHLVGIGGAGMSAIARVLLGRGYVVSGSDMQVNEHTRGLRDQGATVHHGHKAAHIGRAEALVISSAVPADNVEVAASVSAGIPVLKRADLLGMLMEGKVGVAVAGTHGKTTTTGMIAQIMMSAELDPTVVVGGVLPSLGSNGRYGAGEHFLVEADEYDHMFLGLRPRLIVITNLEHDHPDIFPTNEDYTSAFVEFSALLPSGGQLIVCADDSGVAEILPELDLEGISLTTYGIPGEEGSADSADLKALDCRPNPMGGTDFLVEKSGNVVGLARLRVPGMHNVQNALGAIGVALALGIEFPRIRQALADFGGIGRRFQVIGEIGGVTVIDDYAHHPTEIRATLAAARQRYPGRRLWAVWQPHTFSRTRLLAREFAESFSEADRVVALDIYRSREQDTLGVNTSSILGTMKHPNAVHKAGHSQAAAYILDRLRPDDIILTLSAGDGNVVGQQVLEGLHARLNKE